MGIRIHVWGERACFTRPEFKVERMSYDVITPSAARGVLEAIHWKPAIRWHIDRLHVLRPIKFQSIRRNEVGAKASVANARRAMAAGHTAGVSLNVLEHRQQRAATVLVDVGYVIDAHLTMTDRAEASETEAKHLAMFTRRASHGQCFHRPCLGTREFPAEFALLRTGDALPPSNFPAEPSRIDLGWMLHSIRFDGETSLPRFFRAEIVGGAIAVPSVESAELVS